MSTSLILIISLQCQSKQYGPGINSARLTRLAVFYQWQVLRSGDSVLTNVEDSLDIFYYNDLTLYRIGVDYEISALVEDNREEVHAELLSTGRNYRFFIFQDKQSTGWYYNSLLDSSVISLPVDSFLNARLSLSPSMFDIDADSLVWEKIDSLSREAIYIPRHKPDLSYPDSIYMDFSAALNKVRFSFSEKMDNRWKKKLYKVRFVYNPSVSNFGQTIIPRREFVFRFDTAAVSNVEEILGLFEKYIAGQAKGKILKIPPIRRFRKQTHG